MIKNTLVKWVGFPSILISGDTLVTDRWLWIRKRLPVVKSSENNKLLDVGCGPGPFTIGAARRGWQSLGLSWDKSQCVKGTERANFCKAPNARFSVCDVRRLDKEKNFVGQFDVVICMETIEHIINDQKLMADMGNCLKMGGKLLLSSPNFNFIPMYYDKKIPPPPMEEEDGTHVRWGYLPEDFHRLCDATGFTVNEISYCSGFFSQKITSLYRFLNLKTNYVFAWVVVSPLRILPLLFDRFIKYTNYSICLVATKTRQL